MNIFVFSIVYLTGGASFCGTAPAFGFTVAEGSHALEKVFALEDSDISAFCSLLVSDLGENGAKNVAIAEYASLSALKSGYSDYTDSLDAILRGIATAAETAAPTAAETTLPTQTESAEAADESAAEETASAETLDNESQGIALFSDTVTAQGTCGSNLTWVLDANGVLTISGTGPMEDYGPGDAPWYSYISTISSLVLEAGITTIGKYAFYNCSAITGDLMIPDSVTTIGNDAFINCSAMTGDLVIPDSVTVIGEGAFSNCTGLNGSLTLPQNLSYIGCTAFSNCKNITGELVIPDGITGIDIYTFYNMSSLTSIVFGENVTRIGSNNYSYGTYNPFYGCTGVKTITFKGLTVPAVYGPMLSTMTALETVYVPADAFSAYISAYRAALPGTARMKSTGVEGDFQIDDGVLLVYLGDGGEVVIPDKVTEIGPSAFLNCPALTKVTIPAGVTAIGDYAFSGCTGLTAIGLPERLTRIGSHAFAGCTGLTGGLTISAAVTSIGDYAFYNCTGLNGKLTIEAGTKTIGSYAFSNCGKLAGLELGSGITSIGRCAFSNCGGISGELVIPDSVTSIGQNVFENCTALTKVAIPYGVTAIGEHAFAGCTGLTEITLPESLTSIGALAFSGCTGLTGGLTIPAAVTSIGNYAFQNCTGLNGKLTIEAGAKTIGDYAFRGCKALTGLELGDGITSIGQRAFYECSAMTGDLVIPDSVTTIGNSAFNSCSGFNGTLKLSGNLKSVGNYAFFNCTNIAGELVIPDSVTAINIYAFYNMSSLTSIVFGENVSSIGNSGSEANTYNPFYGCTGVKTITFHGLTVPRLYGNLFSSMTALETVYVPVEAYSAYAAACKSWLPATAQMKSIGVEGDFQIDNGVLTAYMGADGEVVIPDEVTEIGASVFQNRTALTKVTIPDSVTVIGDYAFSGCTGLTEIGLPKDLTRIGVYAFSGCTGLTGGLTIPASVTSIGNYAFYNCTGLDGELTIEAGAKTIGDGAFSNCGKLTSLELGNGITSIGKSAFYGCGGITGNLVIPDSVTSIGQYAFQGCSGITGELVVPDGITVMNPGVFCGMSKVISLVFGKNMVNIYTYSYNSDFNHALYGMTSLKEITFNSLTVPEVDRYSPFLGMSSLETVYVPAEAYNAYAAAYRSYLPDTARMKSIGVEGDFQIDDGVLTAYLGAGGEVTIPQGVKAIGASAFQNCAALTKVTIPESVTAIGDYAFSGCTGLTEISLPESLNTIGLRAFAGCTGLTGGLTIPAAVTAIGDYAFYSCTGLNGKLTIEAGAKTIGEYAFYNCKALTGLTLGDGITSIGQYAFYGCTGLTGGLTIPAAVTAIGDYAFYNCSGLDGKLTIEAGAKTIGSLAFCNCSKLTGLELGDGITSIGQSAFSGCTGLTGGLTIPATVIAIGDDAFYNCTGLDGKLTIEDGVKTIGYRAFYGCKALSGDLVIPDSVITIQPYAFTDCAGFNETLTLSANLRLLGGYAFQGCSGITGELVVPDGIAAMSPGVFSGMSGVTSLVFGKNMVDIYTQSNTSYHALYGMTGVKEITFNSLTVPAIDNFSPFLNMTSLETIFVPVEAYEDYVSAYSGCVSETVKFLTDYMSAKVTNLEAEKVYSKSVVLSWKAHISDQIAGYKIFRDGELVGTTTGISFTDRELTAGATYTYCVQGYTETGETTPEAEITVTTVKPKILDIGTEIAQNRVNDDHSMICCYAADDKNLQPLGSEQTVGKLYYVSGEKRVLIGKAERDAALGSSTTAVYTVDWDISALEDGEYQLLFVLTDIDGVSDEYSESVRIDRSVPAKIVGVTAIGAEQVIYLNWAISSEADTNIYRIYRRSEIDESFRMVTQINDRSTLTYTDSNVKTDRIYYYYVAGVDEFGQEGEASEIVGATLSADTEAPVVTKITPANASYLTGTVTVGLTAEDNVSVTKTALYYSVDNGETWTLLAEENAGSFSTAFDTTACSDGVVRIKGIAYDAAGNESSGLTYVYSIDNTGPEQVQGLTYESTHITATLSWNDVADEDIYFYRVERKVAEGSYTQVTDVYSTLGANIYNLTPASSYVYRVVGYDTQGNRGTPSENITVTTLSDTTAPVITKIRPAPGYYSDSIDLSVTATDEYSVAAVTLQTSVDGQTWNDVCVKTYTDISKSRTLSYTLNLNGYQEGYLFVRAIAADRAGNKSDSSARAPYVQYMVDKTAPAAPEGVAAVGNNGYIEVKWTQGAETDLGKYSVYRSESENGTYTLVQGGIAAINCIDRNVEEGVVYYYKVAVNDTAGNTSDFSGAVSAEVVRDTEKPVVVSVYPESKSRVGAEYKTVSVLATDNNALDAILIEYSKDGSAYSELLEIQNINTCSKTVSAEIPVTEFSDGETVYIRVSATDKSGNRSEQVTTQYIVDAVAPTAVNASAAYEDESVCVRWTSNREADLSGYRIYRKTGATGSYSLIAQRQAVEGQRDYTCYDYNLSAEKTAYIYRIEAVDECGNASSVVTSAVEIPDRSAPRPVISCDAVLEVGVEYYIDATSSTDNSAIVSYLFDFGDGTTSTERKPKHTYCETGEYTITLTVTDDDGIQESCTKQVTVKERALIGTAKIRIVDEDGVAVAGAPVYFDLGEETQVIKTTDKDGYAAFTAEVGRHTVGCVIADNEWLPVKKDVIVTSGQETSVSMTLVHHVLVEGQFEITRMTFEEIVAAGIDVSKPENQYMVMVNVKLTYGAETVDASFPYNVITDKTFGPPIIIDTPEGKRQIIPSIVGGRDDEDEDDGTGGGGGDFGGDYTFSRELSIAYLDIPVGVSSLKEFFNVNLHIINNASSEFSMLDNVIELKVPDGLTLMDTYASQSNSTVNIAEIKGQTTETITWVLRGDEIGEYYLSADYSGILSAFDEPIYTQFVSTEPIQVYGLSNLKLTVEIPDALDHGTFYYNVSLGNEGKLDVYRPDIKTGDVLIETQLFDSKGANVTDIYEMDAEEIHENGLATSIEGVLDVLPSGYRLTRHYMCVDQTLYTELKQKLMEFAYDAQNTYGLDIEFVTRSVAYFKSNLSANINAADKADLTFTTNQSAFDYLMTNENYIYWSMYASTGEVATALTTNAQETLWEVLKFAAGDGDFKALFGADDEKLIQAIVIDAMELSVKSDDYSKYYAICDWTTLVKDWVEKEGHGEWINVVTKWVNKFMMGATEEAIAEKVEEFGESLPRTFDLIYSEYRWEAYQAVYEGEYLDFDNFIVGKWEVVIEEQYSELTEIYRESDGSKMLHELFSKKSFESIWKAIGIGLKTAKKIVAACEDTSTDVSLFFAAQSSLDSCNLFLEAIANYNYDDSGDAIKVVMAAQKIREKLNELDPVGNLAEKLLDEAFWMSVDHAKDEAIKKLKLSSDAYTQLLKVALKLTIYVGNNVFNVEERHDIADNIRFVSCMTVSMQNCLRNARYNYENSRTDDYAKRYMQLISYMLNLRAIGESQVAQFGISYEVLPGAFDSAGLFASVCAMSGATEVTSWIEWRDYVEDNISMLRVQLLKNPLTTDVSGLTAPVVTFNYAAGRTAQSFSSDYEYSLDGGKTWTTCNGTAISVPPQSYAVKLMVRRVDYSGSSEKMTGSVTIYAPPSLDSSGIRVLETKRGYRVENLDNSRNYEVTFAREELSYQYGDKLSIAIPSGSYSYEYTTNSEYGYAYVRSVADANRYASYIFMPPIYPMSSVSVEWEGQGTITGGGSFEYGEEATLVATAAEDYEFDGWYEDGTLLSTKPVLTLEVLEDHNITAKFVEAGAKWVIDPTTGLVTGIPEGTAVQDVVDHFQTDETTVTVTTADGAAATNIGTGCQLNVGDNIYTIVVLGDVNGDAAIDIFDLYIMLDYINSETTLTGAYLKAGCVCQKEDMDMFDFYAELAYINSGSFTE